MVKKKRFFTLFRCSKEEVGFQTLITCKLKTMLEARHTEQCYSWNMCVGGARVVLPLYQHEAVFPS